MRLALLRVPVPSWLRITSSPMSTAGETRRRGEDVEQVVEFVLSERLDLAAHRLGHAVFESAGIWLRVMSTSEPSPIRVGTCALHVGPLRGCAAGPRAASRPHRRGSLGSPQSPILG